VTDKRQPTAARQRGLPLRTHLHIDALQPTGNQIDGRRISGALHFTGHVASTGDQPYWVRRHGAATRTA